jgi:Serine/threonine protein kinase
VIHRDVKPANVMIDDEGWVVVTDFGIAKVSSATGLTVTGVTVGTPAYMSPEQCLGKEVSGASDQYSLGIVAYEMLTGLPPFSADSAMAVMFAQFQETPKPILDSRTDCPPRLAEIVMRMLEKEPEKRWPTIDDAVAAIGASPLPHDDPTRKQLISMALSSENAGLTRRISTPTSPAPAVRRSGRATVPSEVLADSQTPVAPGSLGETIQPEDGPAGGGWRHPGNSTACGGPGTGGPPAEPCSAPAVPGSLDRGGGRARRSGDLRGGAAQRGEGRLDVSAGCTGGINRGGNTDSGAACRGQRAHNGFCNHGVSTQGGGPGYAGAVPFLVPGR